MRLKYSSLNAMPSPTSRDSAMLAGRSRVIGIGQRSDGYSAADDEAIPFVKEEGGEAGGGEGGERRE